MTEAKEAADGAARRPGRQAITLVGAPIEAGAGVAGCAMGPAMLRTAGIVRALSDLGHDVEDRGDVAPGQPLAHARRARRQGALLRRDRRLDAGAVARDPRDPARGAAAARPWAATTAWRWARSPAWRVTRPKPGGSCSSSGSTPIRTTTRRQPRPSGNMHGMPVAMLSGEPGSRRSSATSRAPSIDPSHVHLFGIRSIDADERRLLKARGVDVVDMRRLDEDGFALSIRRIIERVRAAEGMLHVSLDVDFLDPSIAPGVGTAVPGGASYREAHLVMELLYEFRTVAVARPRRTQSVPRRAGKERAAAGRPGREPVRATGLLRPTGPFRNRRRA